LSKLRKQNKKTGKKQEKEVTTTKPISLYSSSITLKGMKNLKELKK